MSKESTRAALNRFYQHQLDEAAPKEKRAPNKEPEKAVEKACLVLMRGWGWTVAIYEAKARWNSAAERFTSQGMKFGTCDCMGNTAEGIAVAVEFKAPGRLGSFNSEARFLQRQFIVDKVNSNAFACVVDSAERLEIIKTRWEDLRKLGLGPARDYLLSMLPQKRDSGLKQERLFDDE